MGLFSEEQGELEGLRLVEQVVLAALMLVVQEELEGIHLAVRVGLSLVEQEGQVELEDQFLEELGVLVDRKLEEQEVPEVLQ